ncbi:hypothetical protein B0H19DRAFT_1290597 [Mycena capillaripes]|nr:hypothetical protein B0H19DRAFT_1290597 [Mycena capillaripes]
MRLQFAGVAAFIAWSTFEAVALEARIYNNEHHEYYLLSASHPRIWLTHLHSWLPPKGSSSKRVVLPDLKDQIDAAVAETASLTHYFWTGTLPPFRGREDSVEPGARDAARRLGGTTLEDTVAHINMPAFSANDQDSVDTWVYSLALYANASRGFVHVFRGEMVRDGNVFDTQEFPNLRANTNVTGVYQINVHLADEDQPTILWPTQPPVDNLSLQEYQVAVSCLIYSRGGLWNHQRTATTTNFDVGTTYGFFMGGQSSTVNAGALTYSVIP